MKKLTNSQQKVFYPVISFICQTFEILRVVGQIFRAQMAGEK